MLPDNTACNPRNNDPGVISCYDGSSHPNLYRNLEVDYKGLDVNVENILNVLRGRYPENVFFKPFFNFFMRKKSKTCDFSFFFCEFFSQNKKKMPFFNF